MCDSAIVRCRDSDDEDTGPGTLIHAVGKIKDLLEQIYEKFGKRHYVEMAAANERHRFSLAMDQTTNTEAAMQGKWKRDGKDMFFDIFEPNIVTVLMLLQPSLSANTKG